jgi:hypothetical protein
MVPSYNPPNLSTYVENLGQPTEPKQPDNISPETLRHANLKTRFENQQVKKKGNDKNQDEDGKLSEDFTFKTPISTEKSPERNRWLLFWSILLCIVSTGLILFWSYIYMNEIFIEDDLYLWLFFGGIIIIFLVAMILLYLYFSS